MHNGILQKAAVDVDVFAGENVLVDLVPDLGWESGKERRGLRVLARRGSGTLSIWILRVCNRLECLL